MAPRESTKMTNFGDRDGDDSDMYENIQLPVDTEDEDEDEEYGDEDINEYFRRYWETLGNSNSMFRIPDFLKLVIQILNKLQVSTNTGINLYKIVQTLQEHSILITECLENNINPQILRYTSATP
jgi:hypothetical protein